MNSIVVFPEEVVEDVALLAGERARYFHEFHGAKEGESLPASVYGGTRGRATVESSAADRVTLRLSLDDRPLPRDPTTLIVAVPRPQSIKRVLQFGTLLGIKRICFVRADNVQPSYLSSRELEAERYKMEMAKSLEQCFDAVAPEVQKFYSLRPCLEALAPSRGLVADTSPGARPLATVGAVHGDEEVALAVGCEAGWSERELELFQAFRFTPISLGARILRVDSATAVLLSQLKLLRELPTQS